MARVAIIMAMKVRQQSFGVERLAIHPAAFDNLEAQVGSVSAVFAVLPCNALHTAGPLV
jgi:hypothetical protein